MFYHCSTPTTLYMHGNLRSWLTYADLRSGHGTQLEHKKIADSVKELIATPFSAVLCRYVGLR